MGSPTLDTSALAGMHILVVDDEKKIRDIIALITRKAGAMVECANGGAEALDMLAAASKTDHPYQLLLLDLMMPGVNGVQVLTSLQGKPEFASLAIIILSAVKDTRVIQQCEKMGICSYLQKPPTFPQLMQAAQAALAQKQAEAAAASEQAQETGVTSKESAKDEQPAPADSDNKSESEEVPEHSEEPDHDEDEHDDADHDEGHKDKNSTTSLTQAQQLPKQKKSSLGYPCVFEGFPRPKTYALRPGYYKCPFCETTFVATRLVNRALRPKGTDPLFLGLYDGPQDKAFLEFLTIEVIICPSCLYAADKNGFHMLSKSSPRNFDKLSSIPEDVWEPVFMESNPWVQKKITGVTDERKEMVQTASEGGNGLFGLSQTDARYPRQADDTVISWELAIKCAELLIQEYQEETEARLQHKVAGYLLKLGSFYERMKEMNTDKTVKFCDGKRLELMYAALKKLLAIRDIEFRVTQERLVCLSRRFFLADELIEHLDAGAPQEALKMHRKKAMADMRQMLIKDRNENEGKDQTVIERYMEPLENRLYDLEKAGAL